MPGLALTVIVRAALLAVGIAIYYVLLPVLFPDDGGGANIGAGLIAFGLVVTASGIWGLVDGLRQPFERVCLTWSAASLLFAIAWLVGLAVAEADASMSVTDLLVSDLGMLPFSAGLVLVPAVTGAAIGTAQRQQARTE